MPVLFYALAASSAVLSGFLWKTNGKRAVIAVVAFALASVTFAGTAAHALPAHHQRNRESTVGCTAGAVGVGLSWIAVGATAITAEAHAGILTALASGQAGAATAGWAATCPKMAKAMLGMKRWVWTHSGCFKIHVAAMHEMPISYCWRNVPSFKAWVALMSAKTRAVAVAMYKGAL